MVQIRSKFIFHSPNNLRIWGELAWIEIPSPRRTYVENHISIGRKLEKI